MVPVTTPGRGRKKDAQLLEVEQGVCPICNRRVYKPMSLRCVEAAFRARQVQPA